MSNLYDDDFLGWLDEQTIRLRAREFDELDAEHLIEEFEGLAAMQKIEAMGELQAILKNLLLLDFASQQAPRPDWIEALSRCRDKLETRVWISPSLARWLADMVEHAYTRAQRAAEMRLGDMALAPDQCPYTVEEVLNDVFFGHRIYQP